MSKLVQPSTLYKFKLPDLLSSEGAILPECYKKFYREWKMTKPLPVHYKPVTDKWIKREATNEVVRVQDVPIPLVFPPESHRGLWGGEGVIRGFQKRKELDARVPHFWVPNLKKSAVYSEILDKSFSVTVTDRTIDLIIDNKGFDHYLLKTRACDIQSELGVKLKQKLLHTLYYQELYPNDAVKRQQVLDKYEHYLEQYSADDIEWYGLTFDQALQKQKKIDEEKNAPRPMKHVYRKQLLMKLAENLVLEQEREAIDVTKDSSWLTKLNPFSKR